MVKEQTKKIDTEQLQNDIQHAMTMTTAQDIKETVRQITSKVLTEIVEVKSLQGVKVRTFPAVIEASEKTDLTFRVAGQLIRLPINAGTEVKKG